MNLSQHIQHQQDAMIDLEVVLQALQILHDRGDHPSLQGGPINVARRMAAQVNTSLDVTSLPEAEGGGHDPGCAARPPVRPEHELPAVAASGMGTR